MLKKILSSSESKVRTYSYSVNGMNYFLKDIADYRILLVADSNGKIIFEELLNEQEGVYLTPLFTQERADKGEYYATQWTGAIFKNNPSILFGFESFSFGCPSISFIDKKEYYIRIKCDNRH